MHLILPFADALHPLSYLTTTWSGESDSNIALSNLLLSCLWSGGIPHLSTFVPSVPGIRVRIEQLVQENGYVSGIALYGYNLCRFGRINKRGVEGPPGVLPAWVQIQAAEWYAQTRLAFCKIKSKIQTFLPK